MTTTAGAASRRIYLIAHDLRSAHNIGALLRTAACLNVSKVYITGYSPYPVSPDDARLPHEARKIAARIHKTSLGSEHMVAWEYRPDIKPLLKTLTADGVTVCALEQTPTAIPLPAYDAPQSVAILLGREVDGIDQSLLEMIPIHLVIPHDGQKESLNVVQAAAMALYALRF